MRYLEKTLGIEISRLSPLLTMGCVYNTLFTLIDQGIYPNIQGLFVPGISTFFGPPLMANLVYKQFSLSSELLIIFFISLLSFTIIHRFGYVRHVCAICPIIGKSLFFINLRNNEQPLHNVLGWLMVSEISSKIIDKVIFNKREISYPQENIAFFLLPLIGLTLSRHFHLPDMYIFYYILLLSLVPLLIPFLIKENKNKGRYIRRKSAVQLLKNPSPTRSKKTS